LLRFGLGRGLGQRWLGRIRRRLWARAADKTADEAADDKGREADRVQLLPERHRSELVDEILKHERLPALFFAFVQD
jgi:hypothetical protein